MSDLIRREDAIKRATEEHDFYRGASLPTDKARRDELLNVMCWLNELPSAEPERLTDDDFETIRIHLNACKEKLCNQRRWKEADEYQRIIDRFMAFASAEPNQCRDCALLDPNWRCGFWHRFTIPEGFCHNYKEKEEEEENEQTER